MPKTEADRKLVYEDFYKMRQFPKVIGAIDCTHIKIQSPNKNIGEKFRNRKGYFSINVQAVCNSNLEFTNIVARLVVICNKNNLSPINYSEFTFY